MNGITPAKQLVAHSCFALLVIVSLLIVLPQYGSAAMLIGSAGFMSAYVAVTPEQFRSRNGSLTAAICLVAAIWVAAAVVGTLTLVG